MAEKTNIVWIDANIDNEENKNYLKEINSLEYLDIKYFNNVEDGINYIKTIKFEDTKIIISGELYINFIEKFRKYLRDIYVIPKIIIFTRNADLFIQNNKNYEDIIYHSFYNFGGIKTKFDEIKQFLKNEIVSNQIKIEDTPELIFEYIDCKEKLELPLFYKALIDFTQVHNIEKYTELLYSKYSKYNEELKKLLNHIRKISNIPMELLSKYYARAYTVDSDFYNDINKDLRENKKENYLSFIKVLYEGVKLKSLSLASKNKLFRGSKISGDEIKILRSYLGKKIDNLPGAIVFSKSFLSFSKEKPLAEGFLNDENKNKNLNKVLFILEKDDNIDYSLSTHGDIENISFFPHEKEVLFFPFSSFEIKDIMEFEKNNEKRYEIRLRYLGKYLKEIEKDKNIVDKENNIPNSEFKNQIIKFGLINQEDINNTRQLFNRYKQYKKSIINIDNAEENNKENNNDKKNIICIDNEQQINQENNNNNKNEINLIYKGKNLEENIF